MSGAGQTSLGSRATRAVFWSGSDLVLRQGMQFLFMVLLARLLSPEDFGVAGMLLVFTGLANLFIDGGFGAALIQRRSNSAEAESSVFYFNLAMGGVAALAMCAAAPWIAAYLKHPVLRPICYVMAANLFLGAFGSIHTTLLTRELGFRTLMKVSAVATALSGVVAVLLAWRGLGVWSLVWQSLVATAVSVLLLWIWHPWRPRAPFCAATLRSYFSFGGYLLAVGILDVLHVNLHSFLIGRFYSARELGFYSRAQTTQEPLANLVVSLINRVAYPAFSQLSAERERLARAFRTVQTLVMFVNIPVMAALMTLAAPVVNFCFGARWLPCVPILQVLCLAGLLWPLHVLNVNVLKAQGRSDLFFRITVVKQVLAVLLIVGASFHGVMAIAWAQVASSLICFFVNAYYSGVLLGYGAGRQLGDLLPSLLATLPTVGVMVMVSMATTLPQPVLLAASLAAGIACYLLVCRLFRVAALGEALSLVLSLKGGAVAAADGGGGA